MNLGGRLKLAREARGLNQEALAELVPGASQAMISALEVRDSETTALIFEIADALKVDPRWLQTGDGDSGLDRPAARNAPVAKTPQQAHVLLAMESMSAYQADMLVKISDSIAQSNPGDPPASSQAA